MSLLDNYYMMKLAATVTPAATAAASKPKFWRGKFLPAAGGAALLATGYATNTAIRDWKLGRRVRQSQEEAEKQR